MYTKAQAWPQHLAPGRQQVEAFALLLLARARAPMPSFATTWSITHGICCCSEWRSASFRSAASGAGVASFPAPLLALMQGVAAAYGDDWAF